MAGSDGDKNFSNSIAQLYEELLVPLIFQPYADDLVERVASAQPTSVLEIAAGTGVVTRRLASVLPDDVGIVATDLNQPMLDLAEEIGTSRPVQWQQADGMDLPFPDESFDAVVCQFGAMFFPDKPQAFAQARRVLKPGGVFAFNVWDRIEDNEIADTVTRSLETLFPDDPPRFLARIPHGYADHARIRQDLMLGGFDAEPQISTVPARSRSESSRIPAVAYCEGTPLRNEIIERGASRLGEATDHAEQAITDRFGVGPIDAQAQALVVLITR